jgi:hypothetical protein
MNLTISSENCRVDARFPLPVHKPAKRSRHYFLLGVAVWPFFSLPHITIIRNGPTNIKSHRSRLAIECLREGRLYNIDVVVCVYCFGLEGVGRLADLPSVGVPVPDIIQFILGSKLGYHTRYYFSKAAYSRSCGIMLPPKASGKYTDLKR